MFTHIFPLWNQRQKSGVIPSDFYRGLSLYSAGFHHGFISMGLSQVQVNVIPDQESDRTYSASWISTVGQRSHAVLARIPSRNPREKNCVNTPLGLISTIWYAARPHRGKGPIYFQLGPVNTSIMAVQNKKNYC